jgi:methionine-rich copper-binding protein CopC
MKIIRRLLPILAIGLSLFSIITPVLAHAALVHADPSPGAVLDRAPSVVFAWFSQPLSTGSHISIFDDQFQPVDKGQTFIDASDATLMRTELNPLAPGRYTVNWQAMSIDGHKSSGSYDFVVREGSDISPVVIGGGIGVLALGLLLIVLGRRTAR